MTSVDGARSRPDPLGSLGVLVTVVAAFGLLSGLEVMLIGEELSTLGDRLLAISLNDGRYHHLETEYGLHSTYFGVAVFSFSIVRILSGVGLMRGSHWARALSGACVLPGLLTDLVCFSPPLVFGTVAMDLYLPYRLVARHKL